MGLSKSRRLLSLSFLICALLFGMCFDSVQADSFLACQDSSQDSGDSSVAPALHRVQRAVPSEQAYTSRSLGQTQTALISRQTVRRLPLRICRGFFHSLPVMPFSPVRACGLVFYSYTDFHEIISNTVILSYIHSQDGEKA